MSSNGFQNNPNEFWLLVAEFFFEFWMEFSIESSMSIPPPPPTSNGGGRGMGGGRLAPLWKEKSCAPYLWNSIQQFGGANLTSGSYSGNGARLYIPTGGNATTFNAVSTADTFTKTDLGLIVGFPGQFISAGSGIVLEVALDAMMTPQAYGSIFITRLLN